MALLSCLNKRLPFSIFRAYICKKPKHQGKQLDTIFLSSFVISNSAGLIAAFLVPRSNFHTWRFTGYYQFFFYPVSQTWFSSLLLRKKVSIWLIACRLPLKLSALLWSQSRQLSKSAVQQSTVVFCPLTSRTVSGAGRKPAFAFLHREKPRRALGRIPHGEFSRDPLLRAAVEGQHPRIASTHPAHGHVPAYLPQQVRQDPLRSASSPALKMLYSPCIQRTSVSAFIWDAFWLTPLC